MRRVLLLSGAAALALTGSALAAPANHDVAAYLAKGYVIAGKREEARTAPGKPPYAAMQRVLHVTTYHLARGGERVTCETVYDSQLDSLATACQ